MFAAEFGRGFVEAAGEVDRHAADGVEGAGGLAGAGAVGVITEADVQDVEASTRLQQLGWWLADFFVEN